MITLVHQHVAKGRTPFYFECCIPDLEDLHSVAGISGGETHSFEVVDFDNVIRTHIAMFHSSYFVKCSVIPLTICLDPTNFKV